MSDTVSRRRLISQLSKENYNYELTTIENYSNQDIADRDFEFNFFNFEKNELIDFYSMDEYLNIDINISQYKIIAQIDDLHKKYEKENVNKFFNESRDQLLDIITNKFMIGGIISKSDRDGGNVDTIHNVRIKDEFGNLKYASEEMKRLYENRIPYNKDETNRYKKNKLFRITNKEYSAQKKEGNLDDSYTGIRLRRNADVDLDHTISKKEIHDDPGRILAGIDGPELANKESNLNPTDRSINRSKNQDSTEKFIKRIEQEEQKRINKIQELKNKESLTDKERKELHKLKRLQEINKEKMKKIDKRARKEYEAVLNKEYYLSKKFLGDVGKTSLKEGYKMGFQQVLGLFLRETITAIFDEIRDVCKSGLIKGESFWKYLRIRVENVVHKISLKWKEALSQGASGMISGIFSNIVTVLINTVVTTAKNIVRLIRQGFFSIIKAVKILTNPPEGMSRNQIFHEAGKIIIAGLGVSIGILMEETIDKIPAMKFTKSIPVIGELLYSTIFGLMTALVTSLGLWGWDKLDFFGVKENSRHEFIINILEQDHQLIMTERNQWLSKIKENDPERYLFLTKEISFNI